MLSPVVTAPVRLLSIWLCGAILLGLARPAAAAPTRKVSIDTEPSGATVYVGEKEAGPKGVTPVLLDLPAGDNVIIIERENYVPKFEVLTVPKGKGKPVKVTYKLELGTGFLVVATDAAGKGAKVIVDDEEKGTAPGRIDLPAGLHKVEVVSKGKPIYSDTVEVGVGVETSIYAKGGTGKAAGKDGTKVAAKDGKDGKGKKPAEKPPEKDPEELADEPREPREPREDDPLEPASQRDAEPTEISTRDDDPDRLEIKKAPRDEERAAPAGPPRLRLAPLFELGYRYFDYSSVVTTGNLPALRQRGAVLLGLRAEYQPLRSLAGLQVAVAGGYGIPQELQTSVGQSDSVWWRGEADVSYRLGLGKHFGVTALVGYGLQRFRFVSTPAVGTMNTAEALVPAAMYHLARLGVGLGYRDGAYEVGLQVENRPVLAGGAFADRFRSSSADGLAGRFTALVFFGGRFFGRLEGNYARYAWTFGYDQDDLYQAGGATDKMFGFSLAAGAAF